MSRASEALMALLPRLRGDYYDRPLDDPMRLVASLVADTVVDVRKLEAAGEHMRITHSRDVTWTFEGDGWFVEPMPTVQELKADNERLRANMQVCPTKDCPCSCHALLGEDT